MGPRFGIRLHPGGSKRCIRRGVGCYCVGQGRAARISGQMVPGMAAAGTSWSVNWGLLRLACPGGFTLVEGSSRGGGGGQLRHILWSQELGLLRCSTDEVVEEVVLAVDRHGITFIPRLVKSEANAARCAVAVQAGWRVGAGCPGF